MKQFKIKFVREFEVDVEADTGADARRIADHILQQFPKDTCKVLSVIAADFNEQPCAACQLELPLSPKPPKGGKPNGGGSSGGTTVKVPVLADQIAEAA